MLKTVVRSFDENATEDYENEGVTIATQTTLVRATARVSDASISNSTYAFNSSSFFYIRQPKTKHQRPYGWDHHANLNLVNQYRDRGGNPCPAVMGSGATPPKNYVKYGSLPYDGPYYQNVYSPAWLSQAMPPRTVATALDRHREVRRCALEHDGSQEEATLNTVQELADDDPANFSDDSLEDVPPPPPSVAAAAAAASLALQSANKRGSIAWEVSLDSDSGEAALGTIGSTKVVGRGRKKSGEFSSKFFEFILTTILNIYLQVEVACVWEGCQNIALLVLSRKFKVEIW